MTYYVSYKGKPYGPPMTKEEAAVKLIRLRHLFVGMEIVRAEGPDAETEEREKPKRNGRHPKSPSRT